MSVLIKGMEMPKNCCECRLLSGFECRALLKDITDFSVADECPLIHVPSHGRLIDADALKAKQQEDADLFIGAYTLMEKSRRDEALNAVANIVNAPTVIEAEEGE